MSKKKHKLEPLIPIVCEEREELKVNNLKSISKDEKVWFGKKLWNKLSPAWKKAIVVFLAVRVLVSIAAATGYATVPSKEQVPTETYAKSPYPVVEEITFGVWERSDTFWYLQIARDGYRADSKSVAFFPMYPFLIKAVHTFTFGYLHWIVCAVFVSNFFLILALYYVYRIAELEIGKDAAERTIWYQVLYPGSLFLFAPYTESLFLALTAGAFYAARTRRWPLAGSAAALAGLTRLVGFLVIIPLILEFFRQRKEKPSVEWSQSLFIIPATFGPILAMVFYKIVAKNPLAFLNQEAWSRVSNMPWDTLWKGIIQAWKFFYAYPGGVFALDLFGVALAVITGILAFKYLPPSYGAFIWLGLIPPLCKPFPDRMLCSDLRYVSVLFPMFMVMAVIIKNRDLDNAVRLLFTILLGISITLYTTWQFMF